MSVKIIGKLVGRREHAICIEQGNAREGIVSDWIAKSDIISGEIPESCPSPIEIVVSDALMRTKKLYFTLIK